MTSQGGRPLATALLIDDDLALLDTWRRLASNSGLEVETASTWDEGLTMFHILSPDLVIADYRLPGSAHGLTLLHEIRRLRPTVRLVLISGEVEPSELAKAEALGVADRVLSKGDSAAALEAVLEEIERAHNSASSRTDWRQFAEAARSASGVNVQALRDLDQLLTSSMQPDD